MDILCGGIPGLRLSRYDGERPPTSHSGKDLMPLPEIVNSLMLSGVYRYGHDSKACGAINDFETTQHRPLFKGIKPKKRYAYPYL